MKSIKVKNLIESFVVEVKVSGINGPRNDGAHFWIDDNTAGLKGDGRNVALIIHPSDDAIGFSLAQAL